MVDTETRRQIAKRSIARFKETERAVARYFREQGWPKADRRIATAYTTADRTVLDSGDLIHVEPLCVQVKSGDVTEAEIPRMLKETQAQAAEAKMPLALLVIRRPGKSDAGRWWAYMPAGHVRHLFADGRYLDDVAQHLSDMPVRMELRQIMAWLQVNGFKGTE